MSVSEKLLLARGFRSIPNPNWGLSPKPPARLYPGDRRHISLRLHDRDSDKLETRHYHAPYPAEYRLDGQAPESLRALPGVTAAEIVSGLPPATQPQPIAHWFCWIALASLLAGVLLRRV